MIDRIFAPVLTFTLLIGATLAIGAALFGIDPRSTPARVVRVVQLEPVVITVKRLAPADTFANAAEVATQRAQ